MTLPEQRRRMPRPGVIVMQIDDLVGDDVDPELDGALVVFNASPEPVTETVAGLAGREFALAEAQANGSDAVVKTTTWDAATGTVTVPARSVAVLVDEQPPPAVTTVTVAAPNKLFAKAGSAVKVQGTVFAARRQRAGRHRARARRRHAHRRGRGRGGRRRAAST